MADALCGPSNPLQQFKQQTQFDRTLQQDRLTSRQSPRQGFRSHDPNAGLLDPEFEAFQAGVPISDLPQFQHQPPAFHGPSQGPSWASDFQRMHISSPPAMHQQQYGPQPAPASDWAQGFRQHIAQSAPRAQSSASSPQAFQHMARYGGMNGFQSSFSQPSFAPSVQSKGKEAVTEQFDDAAFERAFDQAVQDMIVDGGEVQQEEAAAYEAGASTGNYEDHVDQVRREAMAAIHGHQRRLSQELEAQAIENMSTSDHLDELDDLPELVEDVVQEGRESEQKPENDDDALAATAQELLEKVEHNQTDKFRNSQFLGLMRKLRDREMKVEGDQMVETAAVTDSTQQLDDIPKFDNNEQTPRPLGRPLHTYQPVDTRPPDYSIPHSEQDHDAGRINLQDGQEVVDFLNQRGGATLDDIDPEFMMTSPYKYYTP